MSAVEPSTTLLKWYENKNLLTVSAITGLVLGMLSLGVIVASMGTSSHWYSAGSNGFANKFSVDLPHGHEIEQTCSYGAQVGGVAIAPCIIGFILFAVSSVTLYRKHQQTLSADLKTIFAGIAVAAFSAGLVIGASTILQNGVHRMEDLIAQGRHDNPNASVLDDEVDSEGYNIWSNLWDRLQLKWLDPTKANMNGILTAGVFGAIGGGALCAAGIFGRGIFSCYKRCKKVETQS